LQIKFDQITDKKTNIFTRKIMVAQSK